MHTQAVLDFKCLVVILKIQLNMLFSVPVLVDYGSMASPLVLISCSLHPYLLLTVLTLRVMDSNGLSVSYCES